MRAFSRYSALATLVVSTLSLSVACSPTTPEQEASGTPLEAYEPEAATGLQHHQLARSERFMVAAANPYAAKAGRDILAAGGSAIDAAVAVQTMLTLVEPQSSGIGGGAFILYWDATDEKLYTLDARETAPQKADENLFLDQDGEPAPWIEAVVGGRSVGVPGIVRGLEQAHQRWGELPWRDLFNSTIAQAEQGFEVSPRLARLVELEINPGVRQLPAARAYFFPDDEPLAAGMLKTNTALADTLRRIARHGADAFYSGFLAEQMVAAVQQAEIAPGRLSLEDLASYQATWREPVCGDYRQQQVCSMGPPSSGGVALLQTLGMLQHFDLSQYSVDDVQPWHLFTQASRLAFADRNTFIADPDFVDVPVDAMLDPAYLQQRATQIQSQDMGEATAGLPHSSYTAGVSYEQPSTTHISIVDAQGNALSMTSSIEMGFGSAVMVGGFLLNNQLTDFALSPRDSEGLVANRVEPGKRPRSSMTPVMTFATDGTPQHILGSPGGPRIINYVGKTLIGLLDFQLDMQAAIELPNVTNLNGPTAIELELAPSSWQDKLEQRGHTVQSRSLNSGVHGISRLDGALFGGADPRREGVALGESSDEQVAEQGGE